MRLLLDSARTMSTLFNWIRLRGRPERQRRVRQACCTLRAAWRLVRWGSVLRFSGQSQTCLSLSMRCRNKRRNQSASTRATMTVQGDPAPAYQIGWHSFDYWIRAMPWYWTQNSITYASNADACNAVSKRSGNDFSPM